LNDWCNLLSDVLNAIWSPVHSLGPSVLAGLIAGGILLAWQRRRHRADTDREKATRVLGILDKLEEGTGTPREREAMEELRKSSYLFEPENSRLTELISGSVDQGEPRRQLRRELMAILGSKSDEQ
jgi:hypothetical protein